MENTTLSLFEVSSRLGVSPSAIKKRVANLYIPVDRGARGKLIFDAHAFALLEKADELLKSGHGFEECRRQLGLGVVEVEAVDDVVDALPVDADEEEQEAPAVTESAAPPEALATAEPSDTDEVIEAQVPQYIEVMAEALEVAEAPVELQAQPVQGARLVSESSKVRPLAPPVFIQLGRRKPNQSEPTSADEPDLISRLDSTLKLLEDKDKQNQTLQAKLLVAYDEMTKLSATAAAFQERSLNLQHEVQKLQSELKLLGAPAPSRPWWKFWG